MNRIRTNLAAAGALLPLALVTACGGGGGQAADGQEDTVELTLAHTYTEDQAPHTCGAQVIKEEVESADAGLTVEIFPASQLGGDSDRIASVQSGDIDIDLQGASALAAVHEPIGVVDAAYAFQDGQHLVDFFRGPESDKLKEDFQAAAGGVRILGAWSIGARHFTADKAIRQPADLDGLRMRFPGSPQFLLNAKALGARATEVAYEELYLALQQGTVDGQENPLSNIEASNLPEVQDYLSLSGHAQNSNVIVVGDVYDQLSQEQQDTLDSAVKTAVDQVPGCVEEAEQKILDEYRSGDQIEVVDDVDTDAFREKTDAWFRDNLQGGSLEVYEAIRSSAP